MPAEPRLGVIVPAAGESTRLGQPKQLLSLAGEPLVARAVRLALGLSPTSTVVVTGAHAEAVRQAMHGLPVMVAHHAEWRAGLGGSIAAGARSLPDDVDAILIILCDQWRLQAEDLHGLLRHWRDRVNGISAARAGGVIGPPVVFPSRFISELRKLQGPRGARALIEAHPAACSDVAMPNAAHDLDTAAALAAMRRLSGAD
jgi:molybdenum cofactor cytidylyltransferase